MSRETELTIEKRIERVKKNIAIKLFEDMSAWVDVDFNDFVFYDRGLPNVFICTKLAEDFETPEEYDAWRKGKRCIITKTTCNDEFFAATGVILKNTEEYRADMERYHARYKELTEPVVVEEEAEPEAPVEEEIPTEE